MAPHLVSLSYSPWSERARWALEHHRIAYRNEEYLPMLGEPMLRLRTRKLTGKITVPVLFADHETIFDSFEIARWADRMGQGTPLFPDAHLAEIKGWNQRSEEALDAGRALTVVQVARSSSAKRESLPSFVPDRLRPLAEPVAAMGASFLIKKYKLDRAGVAHFEEKIANVLEALRKALGGRDTILDRFSYADVTMATALQFVSPVAEEYIHLGEASRECWTHRALAKQYADMVEWRDAIYARHRRVSAASAA